MVIVVLPANYLIITFVNKLFNALLFAAGFIPWRTEIKVKDSHVVICRHLHFHSSTWHTMLYMFILGAICMHGLCTDLSSIAWSLEFKVHTQFTLYEICQILVTVLWWCCWTFLPLWHRHKEWGTSPKCQVITQQLLALDNVYLNVPYLILMMGYWTIRIGMNESDCPLHLSFKWRL